MLWRKNYEIEVGSAGLLRSSSGPGWRAEVRPSSHPVSDFDFDVVIGADGRKNTLDGEEEGNRTHRWERCCGVNYGSWYGSKWVLRKGLLLTHICRTNIHCSQSTIYYFYWKRGEVSQSCFQWLGKAFPVDIVLTGSLIVCMGSAACVSVCAALWTMWELC